MFRRVFGRACHSGVKVLKPAENYCNFTNFSKYISFSLSVSNEMNELHKNFQIIAGNFPIFFSLDFWQIFAIWPICAYPRQAGARKRKEWYDS